MVARSTIIPNSFQTPNLFIDDLMPLLTPQEWVVLSFATRHIFGWQDRIASRRAHISLSMFTSWGKDKRGCGLSKNAVSRALTGLQAHEILRAIGEPGEQGQLYELTETEQVINWAALKERAADRRKINIARTENARSGTGAVVSHKTPLPVVSHNTPPVVSHTTNQTQSIKPKQSKDAQAPLAAQDGGKGTRKGKARDARLDHPAIAVYRTHALLHIPVSWREEVVNTVGSEVEAVNLWEKIVHEWIGYGWNKQNIKGMLGAFVAGGLGERGATKKQQHTEHAGVDEMTSFIADNPGVDVGELLSSAG